LYCLIVWCHICCAVFLYHLSIFGFSKFCTSYLFFFFLPYGTEIHINLCFSNIFWCPSPVIVPCLVLYHVNWKSYNQK
jgi:hypothetical protein